MTGKPLGTFGIIIALLCLIPWTLGYTVGIILSPFVAGYKIGCMAVCDIARSIESDTGKIVTIDLEK